MRKVLTKTIVASWKTAVALLVCCLSAPVWSKEITASFNPASVIRIEGPVQGSGTLVAQNGDIYTLLTAWHVLSSVREGEELYAVTNTGASFQIPINTIRRIGNVDIALARFRGPDGLKIAKVSAEDIRMGEEAEIFGYPVNASKRLNLNKGYIVANAKVGVEQGYQLLYKIETSSGMSGGPVVDKFGNVVGVHGRGELDERAQHRTGQTIKTGVNYGVPVKYLVLALSGKDASYKNEEPISFEDYYAKTLRLWRSKKDHGGDYGIELSSKLISLTSDKLVLMWAHLYRRDMYDAVGKYKQALVDNLAATSLAESMEMKKLLSKMECYFYLKLEDNLGAIKCYDRWSLLDPVDSSVYGLRGFTWSILKEWGKALNDFEKALKYHPTNIDYLISASRMNWFIGDMNQSMHYINMAVSAAPNSIDAHIQRALTHEAIANYSEARNDLTRAGELLPSDDPRKYDVKFMLIRLRNK